MVRWCSSWTCVQELWSPSTAQFAMRPHSTFSVRHRRGFLLRRPRQGDVDLGPLGCVTPEHGLGGRLLQHHVVSVGGGETQLCMRVWKRKTVGFWKTVKAEQLSPRINKIMTTLILISPMDWYDWLVRVARERAVYLGWEQQTFMSLEFIFSTRAPLKLNVVKHYNWQADWYDWFKATHQWREHTKSGWKKVSDLLPWLTVVVRQLQRGWKMKPTVGREVCKPPLTSSTPRRRSSK